MAGRLDDIVLREFRVRPIRDAVERASWDGLMEALRGIRFSWRRPSWTRPCSREPATGPRAGWRLGKCIPWRNAPACANIRSFGLLLTLQPIGWPNMCPVSPERTSKSPKGGDPVQAIDSSGG